MSSGDKGSETTMGNELHEWSTFMRATGASAATIRVRTHTMRALCSFAGKKSLLELDRRDVLGYLARPSLTAWSRVTYWRSIKAWDAWAIEFGVLGESILKGVPAPKTPDSIARPIDDDSIAVLLAARLSRRARAYILLGLYEALRVHEIAKVRGEDFDLVAGWLSVNGKGNRTAVIPIHPEVARLAESMPEQGYWFPQHVDCTRHVDAHAVSATIKNAMASAGIRGTAHMLRDTAATKMQREARDLRLTQAFLRHRNVTTTQKYTAVADAALMAASHGMSWGDAA